jgi:hypothetical protein
MERKNENTNYDGLDMFGGGLRWNEEAKVSIFGLDWGELWIVGFLKFLY